MTEAGKPQANPIKMLSLTPKAIIHQKYGDKACYKVEEVPVSPENGCPGLAIRQKAPTCHYRCTLSLPETTIVSDTCKRKKEAEQSAAEKAIKQLGLCQKEYNPTLQEAWNDLADRVAFLFANEFLSSLHPLSGHFRAALRRDGHFKGFVPVSVIAVYDAKTCNISKFIDPAAESNSLLVMSLVSRASKLTDLVKISGDQLSLQRKTSYSPEIISSINHESESILLDVIRIPVSREKAAESLKLNISATGYYLDVIAHALGLTGASDIIISRTIGKASSEMRMYFSAPKCLFDNMSESQTKQASNVEGSLNIRASYFAGQEVYGDAILASVGYAWKSTDLFREAISLCSYYRILVSKIPTGAYKMSRNAILAAQLPLAFTAKNNWRGSLPRDMLCAFCRSHHICEPVFSTQSSSLDSAVDLSGSHKKLKATQLSNEDKSEAGRAAAPSNPAELNGAFNCKIKIYSKNQELLLECAPQESYRKQMDAVQSVALKVLCWLDIYFEKPELSVDKLGLQAKEFDIQFTHDFFKRFALCHSVHSFGTTIMKAADTPFIDFLGPTSGVTPSNGSLAHISYTVSLFTGDLTKEHLESCEEFVFEVGNQSVLPHLDAAVETMVVGQSAYFTVDSPLSDFMLAASGDSAETLSLLSPRSCKLEYCVTLLHVTEPLEDQMEQALFSPPLSKQRVEFAVRQIKESSAASLVDFGCGSGSLLDSLMSYPTSLEKIVGVDLSQKGLAKAAKLLHSKLNSLSESKIKSAVLYDGNITKFDSQLREFDIATCLEVIEHIEEEEACLFGDVVLSSFAPKILIVSTPNYEYNKILQGGMPQGQEDDPDDKNQAQTCKFRNHDHKFEWTRAQFEQWASELASKHNYSVEFSGVGGAADVEPGFASQFAIFRRREESPSSVEWASEYVQIWKWSREEQAAMVS